VASPSSLTAVAKASAVAEATAGQDGASRSFGVPGTHRHPQLSLASALDDLVDFLSPDDIFSIIRRLFLALTRNLKRSAANPSFRLRRMIVTV
jgi:hypothetical protein